MSDDKRTPLEKTFDLPASQEDLMKELEERYSFSSNPNLNEVAKLALTAYKEQMLDIMNMEPKYRSRALEVANQYLNLAKDALAKDEDLSIKRDKIKPKEGEEGETEEPEGEIDRNEFLVEIDKFRRKKKAQ